MIEVFVEILKIFVYLFIYIKNFRKWQMHILGAVTSIAILIYIPKGSMLGRTTMEWLTVLIPVSILLSGVTSAWVYSKATSSEEELKVENCYKNEIYHVDKDMYSEKVEYKSIETIEEGVEDIIPLKNGGFRRIYRIRRFEK